MSRASALAAVAVGAAAAGALAAVAYRPASGPARGDIEQLAGEIDARLREATAEARSRAQTLADLPRLALAVATDAATVRDLTTEELAFRPRPGETIEIAQVPRAGGAPMSLLRLPPGAAVAVPLATPGVHLVRDGAALRAVAIVQVEPRARANELVGVVAVSRPVDLELPPALLEPLGGGVEIESAAGPVQVGGPLAAGGATIAVPLGSEISRGARLIAPAPSSTRWNAGLLTAAFAAIALGLIAAGLLWRRTRMGPPGPTTVAAVLRSPTHPLPPVTQFEGPPRPDLPESFRIGRYSIIRRLGAGGMADVYLARAQGEAGFERLVALKVIQDEWVSNPKFVNHFLDEARLASNLSHPNIIAITDLGQEDGKYVIAMEFVDGADLERLIHDVARRKALVPVSVGLAIVRHICDGLHFAHMAVDSRGDPLHLVHRDVKSANVFVARTGAVKIGDFGIAKAAGPQRQVRTEVGEIKGTAAYMSPEQRVGQDVDLRADIYSVGAIAYELLTGRVINLDFAMLAHLGREGWPHLPRPSTVRPELPPELDAIVFGAMAFDPAARFPTCEALELAIADVVERHRLWATDKNIARWIGEELPHLPERFATGPAHAAES
ncbi:MAG TPA: serine/threonine-protein kinase [Kofleriaceae bacterium]|nr:serine/threonine-protein kinase [Kofleriaceae bacterium]